jgi:hypothetical protein
MSRTGGAAVIEELRARKIDVSRRGDDLRLRGPEDAVDSDLVTQVRAHKREILHWLDLISWIASMPLSEFERQHRALELRLEWWHETVWLVPSALVGNSLLREGVFAGRIWSVRELADLLAVPGRSSRDISSIAKLKLAFDAEIVSVVQDNKPEAPSGKSPGGPECRCCRGRRYWRSTNDVVVCAACHPPAAPDLVAAWIEPGA